MNKTVFFRDDDLQDCDDDFKKFLGLFLLYKVPIHLAVIPGKMTLRCGAFLRQCLKKYPDLVEIGQHGYEHLNYSPDLKVKYEFGARRSYVQQRKDIIKGKEILSKVTGANLIFTPPWHGYDQNTLKIIAELRLTGISLDKKSSPSKNAFSVNNYMTQVYLNKKSLNGWFVEQPDVIIKEIKAAQGIKVGVLSHHQEFKNDKEFEQLSVLLSKLKKIPKLRFCKLSEALS